MPSTTEDWALALGDSALRQCFGAPLLARAEALRAGVGELEAGRDGATLWLSAAVQGSRRYQVRLWAAPGSQLRGECGARQIPNAQVIQYAQSTPCTRSIIYTRG